MTTREGAGHGEASNWQTTDAHVRIHATMWARFASTGSPCPARGCRSYRKRFGAASSAAVRRLRHPSVTPCGESRMSRTVARCPADSFTGGLEVAARASLNVPVTPLSAESALEALLRSDRVGIAFLDRELRYCRVNSLMAAINQRPIEAHPGRTIEEVLGAVAPEIASSFERVLTTGEPVLDQLLIGVRGRIRVSYFPTADRLHLVAVCVEDTGEPEGEFGDRLRFELLLAQVTADLVGAQHADLDAAVDVAVKRVGDAQGIDRVVVYDIDNLNQIARVRHCWSRLPLPDTHRPGFERPIEGRYIVDHLTAGRILAVEHPDSLPAEHMIERRILETVGIQAVLLAPLRASGQLLGAVAFECVTPRPWPQSIVTRIGLFAEILTGAVHRRHLEDASARQRAFEQRISEISARFVANGFQEIATVAERIAEQLEALAVRVHEIDPLARSIVPLSVFDGTPEGGLEALDPLAMVPLLGESAGDGDVGPRCLDRDDAPPAIREVWTQARVEVGLVLPLVIGRALRGCLSVDLPHRRQVEPELMARAVLLQNLLTSVLARTLAERSQAAAHAELVALKSRIEGERDYLREAAQADLGELVVGSAVLRGVLEQIANVAPTDASVLLVGETGVGKEVLARRLHAESARADGPLIKVNCASIPDELFESEFFGHVKGSFTGAHRDRRGRFELADGGTLFLDEVGEIPPSLQAKLLRVLQEGELERVGDDRTLRVDVRLIAATNRDLEADVEAGNFRRDLYYRLSVFPIRIPPLRERPDDILPLARRFLARHAARLGRRGLVLDDASNHRLLAHSWPGNVRELDHVLERAAIITRSPPLQLDLPQTWSQLPPAPSTGPPGPHTPTVLKEAEMRALERENVARALEATAGRISGTGGAAELLGMSPSTLRDRIRTLGLARRRS
jgi:transcriptional regulator with GAF, ATPase, and Fis domain